MSCRLPLHDIRQNSYSNHICNRCRYNFHH
ncbi:MAG: hypothetical protein HXN42_03070 [Prevotella melaninogenica]|nr:hypothetical protein [Prevotella melaninogenica]MBF1627937.1 hypothetical protein [Prevotella sp.]